MENRNFYCDMVEDLHMPERQYNTLKNYLMKQYETEQQSMGKPLWKRYAAAAVFVLCLLAGSGTAYAAYKYQWFSAFFTNGAENAEILSQIGYFAETEQVTEKNENYQVSVLRHVYSKEQNMGLLVCSLRFLDNTNACVNVENPDKGVQADKTVDLTKDGIVPVKKYNHGEVLLRFEIGMKGREEILSHNQVYYMEETAEDGGYLLGIRYDLEDWEKRTAPSGFWLRVIEERGDEVPLETALRLELPKAQDMKTTTLVSADLPESSIVLSPIGMMMYIRCERNSVLDQGFAHEGEILNDICFVFEDQTTGASDLLTGYISLGLTEETDKTDTWCLKQGFSELMDVDKLLYVDLNGVKFVNANTQP